MPPQPLEVLARLLDNGFDLGTHTQPLSGTLGGQYVTIRRDGGKTAEDQGIGIWAAHCGMVPVQ
jgi:hypothetical protein